MLIFKIVLLFRQSYVNVSKTIIKTPTRIYVIVCQNKIQAIIIMINNSTPATSVLIIVTVLKTDVFLVLTLLTEILSLINIIYPPATVQTILPKLINPVNVLQNANVKMGRF